MGQSIVKKDFKGVDLDGNEFVDTYYFILSKAEIAEKEVTFGGKGYAEYLKSIVEADDRPAIIAAFKDLILTAVGVRDPLTNRLVKTGAAEKFLNTSFYSELFMEILTDHVKSAEFFRGVMPAEVSKHIDAALSGADLVAGPKEVEAAKKTLLEYNEQELLAMGQDEFDRLLATHKGHVPMAVLQIAMRRPRK